MSWIYFSFSVDIGFPKHPVNIIFFCPSLAQAIALLLLIAAARIKLQSKSKLLYDWRSVSQSACLGIEHPCGTCCLKFAVLYLWGDLSDERMGLQFASGLSRAEPVTIIYCVIWDSPAWRARIPYLYPPAAGWSRYTSGHWVVELQMKSCGICRALSSIGHISSMYLSSHPAMSHFAHPSSDASTVVPLQAKYQAIRYHPVQRTMKINSVQKLGRGWGSCFLLLRIRN
jgi:hypothetical protein